MRGYFALTCPDCEHIDPLVWLDFAAGRTVHSCSVCGKYFGVLLTPVPYDPSEARGEASPLWEAAVKLLSWIPEWKTPEYFARHDVEHWNMHYHTEEQKANFLKDASGTAGAPFISESYLYHCLGKEDARTLLSLLRQVLEAGGITMHKAEVEAIRRKEEDPYA